MMAPYRTLVSSFLRFSISSSSTAFRLPANSHTHTSVAGIRTDAAPIIVVPAPPKRPKTAYLQYVTEQMPEYTKRSPGVKLTALVKIIAQEWNSLEEAKKKPYQEKFQAELKKYKESELQWKASLTPAQQDAVYQSKQDTKLERSQKKARRAKKKLNEELQKLGKPKKPRTAFNIFVMEKVKPNGPKFRAQRTRFGGRLFSWLGRGSEGDTGKPISLKQVLIEAGRDWRKMTPEEKEPYYIIQAKDIEQYHKEMETWKKRMEKEGFGDLIGSPKKRTKKKTESRSKDEATSSESEDEKSKVKKKTAPKRTEKKS